eukprot:UN12954
MRTHSFKFSYYGSNPAALKTYIFICISLRPPPLKARSPGGHQFLYEIIRAVNERFSYLNITIKT